MNSAALTQELYTPGMSPETSRRFLEQSMDPRVTNMASQYFGNDNPRPPKKAFYDRSLVGTGVLAWYLDPEEVKKERYEYGVALERELGAEPIMAYNPDIVDNHYAHRVDSAFLGAVDAHEKTHGAQQGKLKMKKVGALTKYGFVPLGEMIIEGSVEVALKRGGIKPPSEYFDNSGGPKQPYSIYRDFVYAMEAAQPGITRQLFRAAHRAGPNAVVRLLENVPNISGIVEKYASELHSSSGYRKAA